MSKIAKFLACFWCDEGAGIGVEYAVLLMIIAFGMAVSAVFVAGAISNALESGGSCLNAGAACAKVKCCD